MKDEGLRGSGFGVSILGFTSGLGFLGLGFRA